MKKMNDALTAQRVRELFDYDAKNGWLIYKVGKAHRNGFLTSYVGKRAGNIRPDGERNYDSVKIDGVRYYLHRVIWLHQKGQWPTGYLDHIDTDRRNNRIENLRETDPSLNGANARLRADNKSGVKGVYYDPRIGKFEAFLKINYKKKVLGYYKSLEAAAAVREYAAKQHWGEHARHEQRTK